MAAATVGNKLISLLAIFLLLRDAGGILPTLTTVDISREVTEKCVIAVFPSENGNLREIADEIGQLFLPAQVRARTRGVSGPGDGNKPSAANETRVTVGIIEEPFDPNDDRVRIKNSVSESENDVVIVFPQIKKDRTCLIPPPKSFLIGEAYHGPISKTHLLEFINIQCLTYVDASGGLNIEGLHRRGILDTMFYMRYLPESIEMIELSCGKDDGGYCSDKRIKRESGSMSEEESCHKKSNPSDSVNDGIHYSDDNLQNDKREAFNHHAAKYSGSNAPMAKCERISSPSKEDFINYYLKRSRPVVIPNGARHWPAFSKWTMEYLRELYGDKMVHIKLAPDGVFEGVEPASLWEDFNQFTVPEQVSSQLLYPDLVVVRPATQNLKFSEFLDLIQNVSDTKTKKRLIVFWPPKKIKYLASNLVFSIKLECKPKRTPVMIFDNFLCHETK